ncbi:MAG: hypothetical protein HZC02_04960 [Candidatus Levybacteria bacterium]|nr:hypothetical protein [Candidatus Levybacteria bacterium]
MPWDSCLSASGVPTFDCLPILFQNVISAALVFVGIVALFFIMYGGVKYILARGDAKQAQAARGILTYAIIGVIIVVSAFFIVNLLSRITGLSCINKFGFDNCKENVNTHQGEYGCFDSLNPGDPPACYIYADDNSPKDPIDDKWYVTKAACNAACNTRR